MVDISFVRFTLAGGFVIGLCVGLARRHGLVWTLVDTVVAGCSGIAAVVLVFWTLAHLPVATNAIGDFVSDYPLARAVSTVLFLLPAIGAVMGLWLVSLARHSLAHGRGLGN